MDPRRFGLVLRLFSNRMDSAVPTGSDHPARAVRLFDYTELMFATPLR